MAMLSFVRNPKHLLSKLSGGLHGRTVEDHQKNRLLQRSDEKVQLILVLKYR